jgi:hypothetical protein
MGQARQRLEAGLTLRTLARKRPLALVTPDPALRLEHFERAPQRASPDADLRSERALRREALLRTEGTVVEQAAQPAEREIRTVGPDLGGHDDDSS